MGQSAILAEPSRNALFQGVRELVRLRDERVGQWGCDEWVDKVNEFNALATKLNMCPRAAVELIDAARDSPR